jgi:hypothetical protein
MPLAQHGLDRNAQAAHEADDAAGLRAHVRAHAIGRIIDAIDRRTDGVIAVTFAITGAT